MSDKVHPYDSMLQQLESRVLPLRSPDVVTLMRHPLFTTMNAALVAFEAALRREIRAQDSGDPERIGAAKGFADERRLALLACILLPATVEQSSDK